ncbi:iron chaperone [Clostridium isatidis]|uniref:Iron chaperone n=1 Tax=Clostridium isatidis TaxID=182773 RepID=A0A343JF86_9CLOT|nr:iron chaperone [Clostridium isatidis]ASW44194.1 iron chaperone [Clostridium isatidis]
MNTFSDFLEKIENPDHRNKLEEILNWIINKFPELNPVIKWNQPMFTHQGTFIIAFSVSKQHIAVAPEDAVILKFAKDIEKSGYEHTKRIFRIKWKNPIDYSLLEKIIQFNILDKADCKTFWR